MSYRVTRPIPFGSRNLPYDFRARQRRALAGLGMLMRRGLGEMVHGVQEEDCTRYGDDIPAQFACAQRNNAAVQASYDANPGSYLYTDARGNPVYAGSQEAAQTYGGTYQGTYYGPSSPSNTAPPPTSYLPRVSFASSRGGSVLQPGDTWQISITGAAPNSTVAVTGGQNGNVATNSMGTTDGNGNFSKSGTITSDQVGNWSETWFAGTQNAGSFSFTVAIPQPSGSGAGSQSGSGQQTPPAGGGHSADLPPAQSSWFDSIPTWGWIAAGVGALLLFKGGK